jgi:hypothetical protein
MSSVARITALALFTLTGTAGLVGCSDVEVKNPPFSSYDAKDQRIRDRYGTINGQDGYTLFSTGKSNDKPGAGDGSGGGGIGVNAFLWRGTLETIDFMPLASADPFGGLIITDWYTPPQSPDERLKLQVLIKDQTLRADGVRVSVFRQTRDAAGSWVDANVDPKTATELEDKILTRARELRVAAVATES